MAKSFSAHSAPVVYAVLNWKACAYYFLVTLVKEN